MKINNTFVIISLITTTVGATTHSSLHRSVESDNVSTFYPTLSISSCRSVEGATSSSLTTLTSQINPDYYEICGRSMIDECRVVWDYSDCDFYNGEVGIGEWVADPDCCNISLEKCEELGVDTKCNFDEGDDASNWHCIYCYAESN